MGCALDLQENVGNNGVDVEQGVSGELSDQSLSSAEGRENHQRTEGESLHGKREPRQAQNNREDDGEMAEHT